MSLQRAHVCSGLLQAPHLAVDREALCGREAHQRAWHGRDRVHQQHLTLLTGTYEGHATKAVQRRIEKRKGESLLLRGTSIGPRGLHWVQGKSCAAWGMLPRGAGPATNHQRRFTGGSRVLSAARPDPSRPIILTIAQHPMHGFACCMLRATRSGLTRGWRHPCVKPQASAARASCRSQSAPCLVLVWVVGAAAEGDAG